MLVQPRVQAGQAGRALAALFQQSFPTVVVSCSSRAQPWYPPSRKPWPLHLLRPLQPQLLLWLPRPRSRGNTWPPRSWAAGCARVFCRCPTAAAVGMPVGGVPRLLSLVAELREEVRRLRSIRESERKIDWWKHTLPTQRQTHEPATTQEAKVPLAHQAATTQKATVPLSRQALGGDLGQGGKWKQVSAQGGRRALSLPAHLTFPTTLT